MTEMSKTSDALSDDSRYRLLIESVTDYAIYMLDPAGFITSWNPGAQRFKGYKAPEIIGKNFSSFYTDEDRATGLPTRALATAAREGKFEGEGWRVRKDGTRFWAHVVIDPIKSPAGELIGYAKITRDLTERKAAEESLHRSEEQFRILVQGVTDYAIYMLDPAGVVTSWNAGAARIKGYTAAEIMGQHFSVFYRPEDRANDQPAAALRSAERNGRFESEGWRVRKDGSHFWANVVVDPIRDDSGAIVGYAKVTRDVTAKRDAQLALQSAQEALFQSQKLDAIGQLTGGVAHDFNNLLTVIVSSLEIVRRRMQPDAKLEGLIENAVKAAKRGASLTQRMLSFARRQDLNPEPVDVIPLLLAMSDLLERSLGPAVLIHMPEHRPMKAILVDSNQLELAILNLAVNARDAMPQGGAISITVDEAPPPAELGLAPKAYVRIAVRDEGLGMDAATLARAIEPFFTTKGVGKGTGLGLSMIQGLASQSGGRFVLKSEAGRGTTAELWLPAAEAAAPALKAETPVNDRGASSRSLEVLVVDDDELVLHTTKAMLEEIGHSVLTASSGQHALALLREKPALQLLLTDHAMPGMSGAELIEIVHADHPGLPVILASGYAELAADLPGAVVKIAKPYDQADLERVIEVAAARARGG
ncbi:MAG: PAS domain S-box protein [Cytophagales bacterium]|nr:PAS domain S-box protein [Rhizobacter sp.]